MDEDVQITAILKKRQAFLDALGRLGECLSGRLDIIGRGLEASARRSSGQTELYEKVWRERVTTCQDAVRRFLVRCSLRPTLCVMGKRGQGKTTLLHRWLEPSDGRAGIEEVQKLPTGNTDTTAALIRLTGHDGTTSSLDPQFLHCEMLGPGDLEDLKGPERPPAPQAASLKILRQAEPGLPPSAPYWPYWICRFPLPKDALYRLQQRDDYFFVFLSSTGVENLAPVQWHARQITVPIIVSDLDQASDVASLLRVVDIIDAPGADATSVADVGLFTAWKRHKNSHVFQVAIKELDVLTVVCSAQIAAINLGAQFQEDIWEPWLERCQGSGEGRLILAFTHAVEFFESAAKSLHVASDGANTSSEDRNFARTIWKNVLGALAVPGRKSGSSLISLSDLATWPPIFFFDESHHALDNYATGIAPGTGAEVAKKLCALLPTSPPTGSSDGLSLGERCILRMAQDWDDFGQLPPADARRVNQLLIRAFCGLLDPEDRGYRLLSHFVKRYASSGAVAKNHAEERLREAEDVVDLFWGLLTDLARPAGNEQALREVSVARDALKAVAKRFPDRPEFRLGDRCHKRWSDAEANASVLHPNQSPFTKENVVRDVVEDSIALMGCKEFNWSPDELVAVQRVLEQCLLHDSALEGLFLKHGAGLLVNDWQLKQTQVVALERTVRILDYLARASDDDLRAVATHCYEVNLEESELVAPISEHICRAEEEQCLKDVRISWQELATAIDQACFPHPYASKAVSQVGDSLSP